jgi:HlyD family secretion protein
MARAMAMSRAWLAAGQVAVSAVTRCDYVQSVVASGPVGAPRRVSIGTRVVGTVKRIPVIEGQIVKASEVLVELERTE